MRFFRMNLKQWTTDVSNGFHDVLFKYVHFSSGFNPVSPALYLSGYSAMVPVQIIHGYPGSFY